MTNNTANTAPQDNFYLPDLCAPTAALSVVLTTELVAIGVTLARQPAWEQFFSDLARTSLLMLWMALSTAAVLCAARSRLARLDTGAATLATILTILAVIAVVSEVIFWLGEAYGAAVAPAWFPNNHSLFLTRNLALGLLVSTLMLRHFYVAHQWRHNVERQAESRILALQARIRPHFLFNSMNTIADLTRSNPAAAESAVEDLADLFRASLHDGQEMVSLDEELEITRVYQRMEKKRLGERLKVSWQVDDLPRHAKIPSLTLQPLLENAIYHGVEPSTKPASIEVAGRRKGDMVYISIRNPLPTGQRRSSAGNQIAVQNIRERLELAFGARARLSTAIDSTHYEASLAFPYQD